MIYKALLSSRLRSVTKDGQRDDIHHEVQAMVAVHDDGSWSLRYQDTDNGGQTSLSGYAGGMTIQREGVVRSRMRFAVNTIHPSFYLTPLGEFDMSTRAEEYSFAATETAGKVTLRYDLLLSGELAAQNQLELEWKKV